MVVFENSKLKLKNPGIENGCLLSDMGTKLNRLTYNTNLNASTGSLLGWIGMDE